jgi:lipid II:glycine glycyltransferase (peptidoglycan interpeptide bridge formation enzyme)
MVSLERFKIVHDPSNFDEETWCSFVLENKNGNIFQTPEMYKVYLNTKQYEPIFTAIFDENKDILATLLGVRKEESGYLAKKFSKRVLILGGPILSDKADASSILGLILQSHNEYVGTSAIFTDLRNVYPLKELQSQFEKSGYHYIDHATTCVDLSLGVENLWNGLKSKRRQAIRKAIKSGLTTDVATMDDLDDIYTLFEETYQRIPYPTPPKTLFSSILSILQSKKYARVVGIRFGEELVAVVINLLYKDLVYAWYCAGHQPYTRLHCNEYAFWSTFEWAAENNFKLFDFGGGGDPTQFDGVRTFKERMGGVTREIGRYECVHHRLKHMIATQGFKIWRAFR